MRTITVRVPAELYKRMKIHKEINWNEVIRNATRAELERIESVSTGAEIMERLRRMGIDEREVVEEPPQGEEEFQKELKKKSTILTPW